MTSFTTNQTARPSFFARLGASLAERRAKSRAYRTTQRELSALRDRELVDLGIHRSMIDDIALQAAKRA